MIRKRKTVVWMAGICLMGSLLALVSVKSVAEEQGASPAALLRDLAEAEILTCHKNIFYREEGCTVVLPTGYVPDEEQEGMYRSVRYPLDASHVLYQVSEAVSPDVLKEQLMAENYRFRMEESLREVMGEETVLTDYRVKELTVDGCPAFQIRLDCQAGEEELEQLIVMVPADSLYTITYSQTAEDGRMEEFQKSAASVRLSGVRSEIK